MNSESILKTLDKMNHSATNLYTMLQNLLAWSMSESGVIKANNVICDLRKLSEEVLAELQLEVELKKITLENTISESFQAVADPKLMKIVLRNLVSNAIKFTPEGGSIRIQSDTNNSYARITVADTGIGISENDLPKLFQVNNNIGEHVNKGTGLGLVLSRDLMEKQRGAITAESVAGKGTTFTLQLSLN
jgi:signal transduction histidine kinase